MTRGGSVTVLQYTFTHKQYTEQLKNREVRAVSRL
jgi:hypothetical protein